MGRRIGRFVGLIGLMGLVMIPSMVFSASSEKTEKTEKKEEVSSSDVLLNEGLMKNLDQFSKVLFFIKKSYVEDPSEKDLLLGAIQGMLGTLDPHSVYMTPEVYKELKADTEGKFGGVGIEITIRENHLLVISPIEGTPAFRAGLKPGDRILKIDDASTKGMGLTEAVKMMRGKAGSKVHLTISRERVAKPFVVTITRDIIRILSVKSDLIEGQYGYVRIVSFQEKTAKFLHKALAKLQKQAKGPLKGLILDLRSNPGGLLEEAIAVADAFLKNGLIVKTDSRTEKTEERSARNDGDEPTYPLIVMVNGGSASASEIVAGALQDQDRAVVLGTQTFGKGSVQTVFDLGDGAALKLTVARYFTPKGRSIQAEGIVPDIIVESKDSVDESDEKRFLRERDLEGHLEGEQEKGKDKTAKTNIVELEVDSQKKVALDYLKSWNLFGRGQ
ncbi:MAG: hypothetical protein A3I75_08070 [Deltaproteobacteria bacterium RIFCSPLOWO2_02_FULL_50_16]|nr:MAG: hypothetical protein A2053_05720 [Deltaproteobacteria bacterium GWA2_50_8]OGQ31486.1 MAG: hypothetical protein A3B79_00135 [Deltaproteobacteria bacterium RIFCSPHIGHO2_02_FULL_50_15]OGQ57461.1 MAG: hypothetical protein A3I75_08070 [Deltaproteobacteria bacterium RIFCSPLOWO2_02_FULL_50_16]OGQ68571.1 MAG: hypothetical protein A3F89_05390 [Deltaproteobacteria bacterium RIFCSPLOWO2_12_FULL_50_11]